MFIVLAHRKNSPRVNMSLYSDTLCWFWSNHSLLFFIKGACLAEKQKYQFYCLWFDQTGVRNREIPHSRQGRQPLHHRFGSLGRVTFIDNEKNIKEIDEQGIIEVSSRCYVCSNVRDIVWTTDTCKAAIVNKSLDFKQRHRLSIYCPIPTTWEIRSLVIDTRWLWLSTHQRCHHLSWTNRRYP